ncbi:hypothetical protein [Limisalsivibrio acetivorans]|uniref:hypothetical protein n=1 Tax=Limisalsivibrio acetivorans TaxID=1304888 RepID=UPI0003B5EE40|nr:hypothetical protein [Limisalsivibrio acetivorans]
MSINAGYEFDFDDMLDTEVLMTLSDFAKYLWDVLEDEAMKALPDKPDLPSVYNSAETDPMALFRKLFYISYFNLLMNNVLGHAPGRFKSHTKKYLQNKHLRQFFTNKQNLNIIIDENSKNLQLLSAIIKKYICELMEKGVSTNRLDSSLAMHYLNAVSTTVFDIRKNDELRNLMIPIEFGDASITGRMKRLFKRR